MPETHYPDLAPPVGWHHTRVGLQVRLLPPDGVVDDTPAMIIVSPLVARQPTLPPPAELIAKAIFAEARLRFEITRQGAPSPVQTTSGLSGVSVEVDGYPRPNLPAERRIYTVFADAICYYALSYVAVVASFATHADAFWAAVRSLRPFAGRVVPPVPNSSPLMIYTD